MRTVKNFALLTLLALAGFFTKATAQVDVTLNPIELLYGDISAGADFAISENFSIEAAVGLSGGTLGSYDYRAIPVLGVAKYYFNPNHGSDRFYVDAFLKYVNRNMEPESDNTLATANWTRFGVGVGAGYKVVSAKGLVFDIGFGVGRALVDDLKYEADGEVGSVDEWPNLMINGKLGVGYRFGGK